jgi:hypothetical protein
LATLAAHSQKALQIVFGNLRMGEEIAVMAVAEACHRLADVIARSRAPGWHQLLAGGVEKGAVALERAAFSEVEELLSGGGPALDIDLASDFEAQFPKRTPTALETGRQRCVELFELVFLLDQCVEDLPVLGLPLPFELVDPPGGALSALDLFVEAAEGGLCL